MTNGDIQNKYILKLLNKTDTPMEVRYEIEGLEGAYVLGLENTFIVEPRKMLPVTVFVRLPTGRQGDGVLHDIQFTATSVSNSKVMESYKAVFITPKK
jgi:polyferredoxin